MFVVVVCRLLLVVVYWAGVAVLCVGCLLGGVCCVLIDIRWLLFVV